MFLDGKRVLITGGTGSLGKTIVRRLLTSELGSPESITVFSRDEAKQYFMRLDYLQKREATHEIIYRNFERLLRFRIGDVRDYAAVLRAVRDAEIVVHAAALKQVPSCEYFPLEAIHTNILGAENITRAISENDTPVETVVAISTDKACKPINVMGMTKALMERLFIDANMGQRKTRFACVRYGNVIASRGSVVPLFLDQIATGGPITVTVDTMTRFLLPLEQAADTVFAALQHAQPGEIYIPKVGAARILDLAEALIDGRQIPIVITGIRPGEKLHEIMVSVEESERTIERGDYYVIKPMLPELNPDGMGTPALTGEYSSENVTLDVPALRQIFVEYMMNQAVTVKGAQ